MNENSRGTLKHSNDETMTNSFGDYVGVHFDWSVAGIQRQRNTCWLEKKKWKSYWIQLNMMVTHAASRYLGKQSKNENTVVFKW